jgi:ketosteroid isomerase-like protein
MRSRKMSVMASCVVALAGLAGSMPSGAATAAEDVAALRAASEAFDVALKASDAEAMFAHCTADVVLLPPGEPALVGLEAVRSWWDGLMSVYRTTAIELSEVEYFVGDDVGVVLGKHVWTMAPNEGGEPFTDVGHYLQVWQRQADGRWLFTREIWNSAAPAAP